MIPASAFNGSNVITPIQATNLQQTQQQPQQAGQQQTHQNAQQQPQVNAQQNQQVI